ncbi:hypothetical protein [Bacillus sp. AK128]
MDQTPNLLLKDINVNVMQSNAGIFIGSNRQSFWSTQSKSNHGFGSISGNGNKTFRNVNIVVDPDVVDSPTYRK